MQKTGRGLSGGALHALTDKSNLFKREGLQFLNIIDIWKCGGEKADAFGRYEEGN